MVVVFGAGMAMHFNLKDLGLGAGVSRTVFEQFGLDCFRKFQDELSDH